MKSLAATFAVTAVLAIAAVAADRALRDTSTEPRDALPQASGHRDQIANALAAMTPREKAALLVVSGRPAPRGAGGVLVQRWNARAPRQPGAVVFVDQEGGSVRGFPSLPPARAPSTYVSRAEAFAAGLDTARALRRAGVDVDLAPVLDLAGGPLGSRHFRTPALGVAFARGLAAGGAAACAKHFPGLGSAQASTDGRPTSMLAYRRVRWPASARRSAPACRV